MCFNCLRGKAQPAQAADRRRRRARRCRSLHQLVPHHGVHQRARGRGGRGRARRRAAGRRWRSTAAATAGPTFRTGATVDHEANGFNPTEILRDFDWGKTTPPRQRPGPARVDAGRGRQGDRGRPGGQLSRPGPTTAAFPGPTLRCREGELLRVRFVNGSEHPHTIHFHGLHPAEMDGVPGIGAGLIEPRRGDHLRVRRRALRPPPLPLPRRAARRAHRPRALRRLHRRPEAGAR